MILISVRQNKTNAAVIIEGPEGVLISKDENKPIITDNRDVNYASCNGKKRF